MFGFNGIGIASGAYCTGLVSDLLAPRLGADSLRIAMLLVTSGSLLASGYYALAAAALGRGQQTSSPKSSARSADATPL